MTAPCRTCGLPERFVHADDGSCIAALRVALEQANQTRTDAEYLSAAQSVMDAEAADEDAEELETLRGEVGRLTRERDEARQTRTEAQARATAEVLARREAEAALRKLVARVDAYHDALGLRRDIPNRHLWSRDLAAMYDALMDARRALAGEDRG